MTAAGAKKTVGIKADGESGTSSPQGGGSGIYIAGYSFTLSGVARHLHLWKVDSAGTIVADYTEDQSNHSEGDYFYEVQVLKNGTPVVYHRFTDLFFNSDQPNGELIGNGGWELLAFPNSDLSVPTRSPMELGTFRGGGTPMKDSSGNGHHGWYLQSNQEPETGSFGLPGLIPGGTGHQGSNGVNSAFPVFSQGGVFSGAATFKTYPVSSPLLSTLGLTGNGTWSFETWYNPGTSGGPILYCVDTTHLVSFAAAIVAQLRFTSGAFTVSLGASGSTTWSTSATYAASTTYHLALVVSGGVPTLYVNGSAVSWAVTGTTGTLFTPNVLQTLFSANLTTAEDTAFWSRAISGGEVASHYSAGSSASAYRSAVMTSSPLGFYYFDETITPGITYYLHDHVDSQFAWTEMQSSDNQAYVYQMGYTGDDSAGENALFIAEYDPTTGNRLALDQQGTAEDTQIFLGTGREQFRIGPDKWFWKVRHLLPADGWASIWSASPASGGPVTLFYTPDDADDIRVFSVDKTTGNLYLGIQRWNAPASTATSIIAHVVQEISPTGVLLHEQTVSTTAFTFDANNSGGVRAIAGVPGKAYVGAVLNDTDDTQETSGSIWIIDMASGAGATDPAFTLPIVLSTGTYGYNLAPVMSIAIGGVAQGQGTATAGTPKVGIKTRVQGVR